MDAAADARGRGRYVVAEALFPGSAPLTAPLTALLVVQLTPVSLLVSGLDRVVSVVAGVGLAVLLSSPWASTGGPSA